MGAKPPVLLGLLQELDDLLQLVLGFVDAGDVVERGLRILLHVNLGLALADRHQAAEALLFGHAADEEHPDQKKEQGRQDPGQEVAEKGALDFSAEFHVVLGKLVRKRRINPGGDEEVAAIQRLFELALDVILADRDLVDLAVLEKLLELAVRKRFDLPAFDPPVLDEEDRENREDHIPEVKLNLFVHKLHLIFDTVAMLSYRLWHLAHRRRDHPSTSPRQHVRRPGYRMPKSAFLA
jgi:hypothetical protein